MKSKRADIAIIGGSGVYRAERFEEQRQIEMKTPYGESFLTVGDFKDRRIAFIARHGEKHSIPPHRINYRANIHALAQLGVQRIISTCAVGSLRDDFEPGTIVLPDQFIDFTKKRDHTFYDDEAVHVSMADPFCPEMRELTGDVVNDLGYRLKEKASYLCIEGPRFSTRAESKMFKQFADVVGMTLVPECQLSREKAICYLCIAMVTDYDVYGEKPVTARDVKKVMEENAKKVQEIIWKTIEKIPFERGCNCREALKEA